MAGSITLVRTSRDIGAVRKKEVTLTLACTADAADGTIPNQELTGMGEYQLIEVQPVPHATVITANVAAVIENANGVEIYDSGAITPTDEDPLHAAAGHPAGLYPGMDDVMTLKFLDPTDHTTAANVGNSKKIGFVFRFALK